MKCTFAIWFISDQTDVQFGFKSGVSTNACVYGSGTLLQWQIQGVRGFRPNPLQFWAGYVINLVCTVRDPGFMEPPSCLLASYTTTILVLAYLASACFLENTSRMAAFRYNRGPRQAICGHGFKNSRAFFISEPPFLQS